MPKRTLSFGSYRFYNLIAIGSTLLDAWQMFLLLLSFLVLWGGPCLLMFLQLSPKILRGIDLVVIVSILFLVVLHIIPESIQHAGWVSILAIIIGALWPLVYQLASHSDNCHLQRSLLSLASIGVLTHTLFDGMAIASDTYLGCAVVLHRLPEGLGIWRVAESAFNRRWGLFALSVVTVSTGVGFFSGAALLSDASDTWIGLFEGLMAGVLLHVVFHKSHVQNTHS